VDAYKSDREVKGFSQIIEKEKIKENDYNLNVTLYVYPEEEVEEIDVTKEWRDLQKIGRELAVIEDKIEDYLEELKGTNNV